MTFAPVVLAKKPGRGALTPRAALQSSGGIRKMHMAYRRKEGEYEFYSVASYWRHPRMDCQPHYGYRRAAGGISQHRGWGDRRFAGRVLADAAVWCWHH